MPCSLSEIQADACVSGIGREQSKIKLLQLIAQLTCEAAEGGSGGSGVPAGVILMWSGTIATIPSGWALCNGSGGTPDLRNVFVVGAQQDDVGQAKTNLTGALTVSGGSISHNHTVNNPAHNHAITDPGHTHDPGWAEAVIAEGAEANAWAYPDASASSATGITIDNATTSVSTNAATAPQPYYALAYIIKL